MEFIEQNEASLRLAVFAGGFIIMAILETLWPRRKRNFPRHRRWISNSALVVIDTLALRVAVPILAVSLAHITARNGWGLLTLLTLPNIIEIILGVILLDLAIFGQHVASHKIPILWRIHKVHHTDRDIDVTTGVRFHPAEIIISMAYKLLCVVVIGPAAVAVIIFEILLNGSAMFNHANFHLPRSLDHIIRLFVVTPDMHRVHHSVINRETDSNYGFFLTLWDRLFRTYRAQPVNGHDDMTIGLTDYQTEKPTQLLWSLWLPFMGQHKTLSSTQQNISPE